MGRTTVPLTVDELERLDAAGCPCRACLFWELPPVANARLQDADRPEEKDAWVSAVLREWGSCGRVAVVDGRPVGLATYAPAAYWEGVSQLPTAPVSPDAVLLSTMWVAPGLRRGGIGRLLVQGVARDLVHRGCGAIEAFGDTRDVNGAGHRCVLPEAFWSRVGFRTQRPHVTTPRMRMDLRSVLTWRDEVEQVLEKLWGAVRPTPAPVPAEPAETTTARRQVTPGRRGS